MGKTAIEWTDTTWNPVVGCTKVSPGCAHCYAETMAARLKAMAQADVAAGKDPGRKRHYIDAIDDKGRWSGKLIPIPEALGDPLRWKKPRMVFVNSMSDLFHKDVPFDFIDQVFAVMALAERHTFQVLTKRPERAAEYFGRDRFELAGRHGAVLGAAHFQLKIEGASFDFPSPNVWIGTSVENQATADERIPHLLKIPAAVRFLSAEPLLGPVNFMRILIENKLSMPDPPSWHRKDFVPPPWIDWCIVGGESGQGARPMHPDWVRFIHKQCQSGHVAFFFKQWGEYGPEQIGNVRFTPVNSGVPMSEPCSMFRVGKKAAGRLLDGIEYSEFPSLGVTGG